MHRRVERLVPVQVGHELLDPPVVGVRFPRALRHRRPEPDVDVQLPRLHRVERPWLSQIFFRRSPQPQRAEPERRNPDVAVERLEEGRQGAHRDLDVLHDQLLHRPLPQGVEPIAEPVPAVEGHDAAVDVRPAVAARPEPADHRVLHAQRARAPEPVGVPAPQVVADGQVVDGPLLLGAVEDLLAGVVARGDAGRQRVDELPGGQVLLPRVEDGAVEEVDLPRFVRGTVSDSATIASVHACASG